MGLHLLSQVPLGIWQVLHGQWAITYSCFYCKLPPGEPIMITNAPAIRYSQRRGTQWSIFFFLPTKEHKMQENVPMTILNLHPSTRILLQGSPATHLPIVTLTSIFHSKVEIYDTMAKI